MKHVIERIYTDGACLDNPGPGGWGIVVYYAGGEVAEAGGSEGKTTNNRMEMQAAIAALEFLHGYPQEQPVTIYTDSEYLRNGITRWLSDWKRKGWKTAKGESVLNQDLWLKLDQLIDQLNSPQINWRRVKGHSGDPGNDRCDAIAKAFAQAKPIALKSKSSRVSGESPTKPNVLQASDNRPDHVVTCTHNQIAPLTPMSEDKLEAQISEEQFGRITRLRHLVETLEIADQVASQGYLITSSELADLMDVNASAVTSRGGQWPWRNWIVTRIRREGNQILWELERVEQIREINES